jgi:RimJ/RimL family protein N-acetyltransferase
MPPAVLPRLYEQATSWSRSTVEDPAALAEQLASIGDRTIIGPAFIGYATRDSLLRSDAAKAARQLDEDDRGAVANLRTKCTAEEWDHGGSNFGKVPTFGAFGVGGGLAAIAGFERWQDKIAHISIVTARDRQARGHGAAAVALAAQHALNKRLLPQYRTLKSNGPSMRLAEKLGFQGYGFSVYVRLAGDKPVA